MFGQYIVRPIHTPATGTANLASASLSVTTSVQKGFRLVCAFISFSAAVSTETATVTIDSGTATAYDCIIKSWSLSSTSDAFYLPENDLILPEGFQIILACTNANTPAAIACGTIVTESIGI